MLHLQHHLVRLPVGSDPQVAAPVGGDVMLHRVLHQGLQHQPGDWQRQNGLVDILMHPEAFAQPLPDDVQVRIHVPQFLGKGDLRPAVPIQRGLQHGGQGLDHGADPLIVRHSGFPVDDLQSIIQEMGVDLGLQCLDVRLLGGLLLQICPLKLPLKLRRHGVELVIQPFKFPVGGFLTDLVAPFAAFHQLVRLPHHFHGAGDMAVKQGNGHQRQRNDQQRHAPDRPAHPGVFPENIVFFPVRGKSDGMSLGLCLIMYVSSLLRRLRQTAVRGDGEAVAVQAVLQVPHPVHRVQGKEQIAGFQQHHHAGIGGEGAVQKVPRHVHLPVDQQQTDVRIRVHHFLHDPGSAFTALPQKAEAGGAVAEDVGAGIHVPEVDKHRLINFPSCKALA